MLGIKISIPYLFYLQPRDLQAEKILAERKNNLNIPGSLAGACLKAIFESSRIRGLFTTYFDEELYRYAAKYYETHVFNRNNYLVAIIGVTRALEDVEISQSNRPLYQDAKRFLEQDFWAINENNDAEIVRKFKEYFTARVIVRLDKEMNEKNLQIVSFSDDRAALSKPPWWQSRGICYAIDSYVGQSGIVAKTFADGIVQVRISSKFDFWIDYTKLTINGQVIFDKPVSAHYNKPYNYTLDVKAGEEIKIQIEWLPHRSDT